MPAHTQRHRRDTNGHRNGRGRNRSRSFPSRFHALHGLDYIPPPARTSNRILQSNYPPAVMIYFYRMNTPKRDELRNSCTNRTGRKRRGRGVRVQHAGGKERVGMRRGERGRASFGGSRWRRDSTVRKSTDESGNCYDKRRPDSNASAFVFRVNCQQYHAHFTVIPLPNTENRIP
jgi:hypothetical protein